MTKLQKQSGADGHIFAKGDTLISLSDLFTESNRQWDRKRKIRAYSNDKRLIESQRKKIIKCAARAFREYGVNGVTMEDIARLSRMSVGSMYRYFGSKRDLLISFLKEFEAKLKDYVQARLPEIENMEPVAALKELIRAYSTAVDRSRDQVIILYLDARSMAKMEQEIIKRSDKILVGLFELTILRGKESGIFKTSDVTMCANNIKALADVWAVRGWAFGERQTVEKYIEYQIEFILGGLGVNTE
jgi:AcrR family transcriptional regulator